MRRWILLLSFCFTGLSIILNSEIDSGMFGILVGIVCICLSESVDIYLDTLIEKIERWKSSFNF